MIPRTGSSSTDQEQPSTSFASQPFGNGAVPRTAQRPQGARSQPAQDHRRRDIPNGAKSPKARNHRRREITEGAKSQTAPIANGHGATAAPTRVLRAVGS